MGRHVDEGNDPDQPPDLHQPWPVQDVPGRPDGERDQQEPKRPVADLMHGFVDRARAQRAVEIADGDHRHRDEQQDQHGQLEGGKAPGIVVPGHPFSPPMRPAFYGNGSPRPPSFVLSLATRAMAARVPLVRLRDSGHGPSAQFTSSGDFVRNRPKRPLSGRSPGMAPAILTNPVSFRLSATDRRSPGQRRARKPSRIPKPPLTARDARPSASRPVWSRARARPSPGRRAGSCRSP